MAKFALNFANLANISILNVANASNKYLKMTSLLNKLYLAKKNLPPSRLFCAESIQVLARKMGDKGVLAF